MNTVHMTKRRGFSLMELLVVIAIMGVVTTLGMKALSLMMSEWREAKIMTDLERQTLTVFENLEEDFSEILSAELSGISLLGEDKEWVDESRFKAAPDKSDRIVIPIQNLPKKKKSLNKAWSVQYEVQHNESIATLYRSTGELGSDSFNTPQDIIPGYNTIAFDIQYSGDNGWVDEWSSTDLPDAVRVAIVVSDIDHPYLQLSRKAVYSIAVQ